MLDRDLFIFDKNDRWRHPMKGNPIGKLNRVYEIEKRAAQEMLGLVCRPAGAGSKTTSGIFDIKFPDFFKKALLF